MKKFWVDVVALSQVECSKPIQGDLKYASEENFLGRPVKGYHPDAKDICLMTREAGTQLCAAQNTLIKKHDWGIRVVDSFRPLRAVQDFAHWIQQPATGELELTRKKLHYPHLEKKDISDNGYLATTVSRHCFGNAVDLILVSMQNGAEINLGAPFDFFDDISHANQTAAQIGEAAYQNRIKLFKVMENHGFKVYASEFWHFDFQKREIDEPADFEISPDLRGLGV